MLHSETPVRELNTTAKRWRALNTQSDDELAERLTAGDHDALAVLFTSVEWSTPSGTTAELDFAARGHFQALHSGR